MHVWRRYDDAAGWQTEAAVTFPITGGREGGFRGFSSKSSPRAGRWRVDITMADGRLIGRVPFSVVPASGDVPKVVEVLK